MPQPPDKTFFCKMCGYDLSREHFASDLEDGHRLEPCRKCWRTYRKTDIGRGFEDYEALLEIDERVRYKRGSPPPGPPVDPYTREQVKAAEIAARVDRQLNREVIMYGRSLTLLEVRELKQFSCEFFAEKGYYPAPYQKAYYLNKITPRRGRPSNHRRLIRAEERRLYGRVLDPNMRRRLEEYTAEKMEVEERLPTTDEKGRHIFRDRWPEFKPKPEETTDV